MSTKKTILVLCVVLLLTSTLFAFDGNRQGFILGFGGGVASLTSNKEYSESDFNSTEGQLPFITNFKIGGGLNEQILIYWSSKVNWFSRDEDDNETWISGIGALSGTYYFKPDIKSYFLSGGIGYATYQMFTSDSEDLEENTYDMGLALFFGGGYEFKKHLNIEAGICRGSTSKENSGYWTDEKITYKNTTFFITINALAY